MRILGCTHSVLLCSHHEEPCLSLFLKILICHLYYTTHMQNMRKGPFARSKVAGKRVLELGSGMGLAGIAVSLMGAKVTFTGEDAVLCCASCAWVEERRLCADQSGIFHCSCRLI